MSGISSTLIELSRIEVAFAGRAALSDVSLAVSPAEIVTVIGPNGAGKTTLLRVALGLQRADGGAVRRRPGLRVGYMPQRLAVDDTLPLTVERFLALVPEARRDPHAALAEVGAGHTPMLPVQTLSGGELQRVLLARALLREPELLVLDEPAQGVDVAGQAELYALIRRLRDRRGCGVLLVTHDLHFVMSATDRVVCLNHHVCCSGHPEAVSRDPAYRALFGPAVEGFALYAHHHDHRHDLAEKVPGDA
ncbi:MAG TPA: zinc ABC transporter ATP-binding protein ZnuC [Stellaceae bacterium]|nr:zinc ABC transporter ATP-binding protein ZnuC [Stellaceae bacterium]